MGVRTLEGCYDGGETKAVMIDSTSGTAFGPLFDDAEEIDAFLEWLRAEHDREPQEYDRDPRSYSDDQLHSRVEDFRARETERAPAMAEEDA